MCGRAQARRGCSGSACPRSTAGRGESDFGYNVVLVEEIARVSALGVAFQMQNDVVLPYLLEFGIREQKQRWLPGTSPARSSPRSR